LSAGTEERRRTVAHKQRTGDEIEKGMYIAVPGLNLSFEVDDVRPVMNGTEVVLITGDVLCLEHGQKAWTIDND
jgi:hypothetical protein